MAELPTHVDVNAWDVARRVTVEVHVTGLKRWELSACLGMFLIRVGLRMTGARLKVEQDVAR